MLDSHRAVSEIPAIIDEDEHESEPPTHIDFGELGFAGLIFGS
jgi:hypothetical protein